VEMRIYEHRLECDVKTRGTTNANSIGDRTFRKSIRSC